jgi:predicted acylesterase/phospholipase RssA
MPTKTLEIIVDPTGQPHFKRQPFVPDTVGWYLTGGGTRGAYQLGIIKAALEAGMRCDHIIGTSTGAINAALFSSGLDAVEEAMDRYRHMKESDYQTGRPLLRILQGKPSIKSSRPFFEQLQRTINPADFKIPFEVGYVDAKTWTYHLGPSYHPDILRMIWASTAVPLQWEPVRIGEREYFDGGVETPVGKLIDAKCERIVIVPLASRHKKFDGKTGNLKEVFSSVAEKMLHDNDRADLDTFHMINKMMSVPGNKPAPGKYWRYIENVITPLVPGLGSGLDFSREKARYRMLKGYETGMRVFSRLGPEWKTPAK